MFKTHHADLVIEQRNGIMKSKPLDLDRYDLDKAEDIAHLLLWLRLKTEDLHIGNRRRGEQPK